MTKTKTNTMEKFDAYLINVGIRSSEFTYDDVELFDNIRYFKACFNKKISAYNALNNFDFYLDGDYEI